MPPALVLHDCTPDTRDHDEFNRLFAPAQQPRPMAPAAFFTAFLYIIKTALVDTFINVNQYNSGFFIVK